MFEESADGWADMLLDFKQHIYPIFEPYGLTVGEALMVFQTQRLCNLLLDVEEGLELPPDEGDEWKRQ